MESCYLLLSWNFEKKKKIEPTDTARLNFKGEIGGLV